MGRWQPGHWFPHARLRRRATGQTAGLTDREGLGPGFTRRAQPDRPKLLHLPVYEVGVRVSCAPGGSRRTGSWWLEGGPPATQGGEERRLQLAVHGRMATTRHLLHDAGAPFCCVAVWRPAVRRPDTPTPSHVASPVGGGCGLRLAGCRLHAAQWTGGDGCPPLLLSNTSTPCIHRDGRWARTAGVPLSASSPVQKVRDGTRPRCHHSLLLLSPRPAQGGRGSGVLRLVACCRPPHGRRRLGGVWDSHAMCA